MYLASWEALFIAGFVKLAHQGMIICIDVQHGVTVGAETGYSDACSDSKPEFIVCALKRKLN